MSHLFIPLHRVPFTGKKKKKRCAESKQDFPDEPEIQLCVMCVCVCVVKAMIPAEQAELCHWRFHT